MDIRVCVTSAVETNTLLRNTHVACYLVTPVDVIKQKKYANELYMTTKALFCLL